MNVQDSVPRFDDSDLEEIERRLSHRRVVVPAWQVQRLVVELRRLKALEEDWRRGLANALQTGDHESLLLAAREIVAGHAGVTAVTRVLPEAD